MNSSVDINATTRMQPQVGDTDLRIPVTIDYKGGRSSSNKSRLLWAIVATVGTVIVTIGILLSENNFILKLIIAAVFFYVATLGIRFLLLREHKYRAELLDRRENDYKIDMSNFWGIYSIDDAGICYFRSGFVGAFVLLEKGAILGKSEEDKFKHYEAIQAAYNIIGTTRMRVCHIDLMDFIGTDGRIGAAMNRLTSYDNEKLRDLIGSIFSNLQTKAENSLTNHDIYLFMYKGSESDLENGIEKVLSCFLATETMYRSYNFLNATEIQIVAQSLFNLHEFSIQGATREAFRFDNSIKRIQPLTVEDSTGTVKVLGKTRAEIKAAREYEQELKKAVSTEKKSRKKSPKRIESTSSGLVWDFGDDLADEYDIEPSTHSKSSLSFDFDLEDNFYDDDATGDLEDL